MLDSYLDLKICCRSCADILPSVSQEDERYNLSCAHGEDLRSAMSLRAQPAGAMPTIQINAEADPTSHDCLDLLRLHGVLEIVHIRGRNIDQLGIHRPL